MNFPSQREISKILKNIKDDDFTYVLDESASNVDKTKFELCQNFIAFIKHKNYSQAELARLLGVDRSRINWIIKCKVEHFTIDRLYGLWNKVDPHFKLKAH